jgi:hypothetical protein
VVPSAWIFSSNFDRGGTTLKSMRTMPSHSSDFCVQRAFVVHTKAWQLLRNCGKELVAKKIEWQPFKPTRTTMMYFLSSLLFHGVIAMMRRHGKGEVVLEHNAHCTRIPKASSLSWCSPKLEGFFRRIPGQSWIFSLNQLLLIFSKSIWIANNILLLPIHLQS